MASFEIVEEKFNI